VNSLRVQDVPGPKRDLLGYGSQVPKVIWPDGAKVAVNLVMNYEEGSEYSYPLGDERSEGLGEVPYTMKPGYRDLAMESVFEYGSRAGIWRFLRLIDEYDIKTTFFACAAALEMNRELTDVIREKEHEPCCHGWRWEEAWLLTRDQERENMQRAIESIKETCGDRPRGWYCRYGPSINTRELVAEDGGFTYDSDAYNDDLPYFVEVNGKDHLIVPYTFTYNDARFIMAQGHSSPSDFFELSRRGLDELWREGEAGYPKMMTIGLHARWIGQAGRIAGLRDFIEYAQEKGDVWFARRLDIAQWWLEHHKEFSQDAAISSPTS
jgi:peptidoglycan/xylan/chitin deacetylase (PgdA/CDA1 family)